MKTYDNLWGKIIAKENFDLAYKKAVKGKKHYKEVKLIEKWGRRLYLANLRREVIAKEYIVSKYHVYDLFTGGKWRTIYKLPMKDRIVQHALMNIIEPIFRENFIVDTYASIKGRGIHRGLSRVKKILKEYNYKYYLDLDIHKCYPSLDKNILKSKLSHKFKDDDLLDLLYKIIDSCESGIPIGNYTSQYFNNFYFSSIDHWAKEVKQLKGYFRYCDDIKVFGNTKEELHNVFKELKSKIEELNVQIKPNYQIYKIETRGINFLGYIIKLDNIRLRKTIKHNFIKAVSKIDFDNLTERDCHVLGSYWGILSYANCRNLWYKYTGVKTFKDLNIKIHDREFVEELINYELTVHNVSVYRKRNEERVKIECSYKDNTDKEHNNIYVSSGGEKLIEAAKQFTPNVYPFTTTITRDKNNYYQFT